MAPAFKWIAQGLQADGTINQVATIQGVTYLTEHSDSAQKLFNIQVGDDNFPREYQRRTKQIVYDRLHQIFRSTPKRLDYVAELYAADAIATINWYWRQDTPLSPAQLVDFIITSYEKGLIKLL